MVLPFLSPHPSQHGRHQISAGLLPKPRLPAAEAAERAGARGFEGTKVKGRAICVAVPPSRGPWGTLSAKLGSPDSATSSQVILVCETCSNLLPSLGK